MSRCETDSIKEEKNRRREMSGHSGKDQKFDHNIVHLTSVIHDMAIKCCYGKNIHWKIGNIHGLHKP